MNRGRPLIANAPQLTTPPRALVSRELPPGAAPDEPSPRLPSLGGVQPYDPPFAPAVPPDPAPSLGQATDFEVGTVSGAAVTSGQTSIITTQRRWRAIDVYVTALGPLSNKSGILSIFVWAVSTSGARTLAASGRWSTYPNGGASSGIEPNTQLWVAAGRAVCERWEVSAVWTQFAVVGTPPTNLQVTAVASDEAVEPPPRLGTLQNVPTAGYVVASSFNEATIGLTVSPQKELVAVSAMNGAAAARYLHMFDIATALGVPANGTAPIMCWPLGAAAGQGVVDESVRYRATRNLVLAVSSTPVTFTNAADCALSAVWR